MRFRAVLAVALASLMLAGCTPPPADSPRQSARGTTTTGDPAQRPTALLPDGTQVALELAVTPEEVSQGLMFRPKLPDDQGMLFLFERPSLPSFWMMNTWVPLDIVFLDGSGRVVHVAADAQPCPQEPCPRFSPPTPARAVLELTAGSAARHGLVPGASIVVRRVAGYPAP